MANYRGCEGIVKVGTDIVAEVKDWSLSETTEVIDVSTLGSCAKKKRSGMTDATGNLTANWDDTDTTGQGVLINGATVTLNLYPAGDTTGREFASFDALITAINNSGGVDSVVEKSIDFEVTGDITWANVA